MRWRRGIVFCRSSDRRPFFFSCSQTELETKIRGLANREKHSSADLDITREELRSVEKHERTAGVDREKVRVGCLVGR